LSGSAACLPPPPPPYLTRLSPSYKSHLHTDDILRASPLLAFLGSIFSRIQRGWQLSMFFSGTGDGKVHSTCRPCSGLPPHKPTIHISVRRSGPSLEELLCFQPRLVYLPTLNMMDWRW
jgi:hypothetical protein